MKIKNSKVGIEVSGNNFNSELIIEQLKPLKIYRQHDRVLTKYEDKILSSTYLSDRYGILNFAKVAEESIPNIEKILNPIQYDLIVRYGVQQLKIYGEKFEDDGEVFQGMFTLFSSSNGCYPMLFNAGLFRQVCSNGLMIQTNPEMTAITKHYSKSIQQNINVMLNRLPNLNEEIESQLKFFRRLKNEEISLRQVYTRLLDSEEKEPRKVAVERVRKLGGKLKESASDAIRFDLSEKQKHALSNPLELVRNNDRTSDIELSKYQVMNCYTETYNNRLHAINWRENQRIKEILIEN